MASPSTRVQNWIDGGFLLLLLLAVVQGLLSVAGIEGAARLPLEIYEHPFVVRHESQEIRLAGARLRALIEHAMDDPDDARIIALIAESARSEPTVLSRFDRIAERLHGDPQVIGYARGKFDRIRTLRHALIDRVSAQHRAVDWELDVTGLLTHAAEDLEDMDRILVAILAYAGARAAEIRTQSLVMTSDVQTATRVVFGLLISICLVVVLLHNRMLAEHQRVTAGLKNSEQRFRDLVNTTEGIVWEADARTFVFTFISKRAEYLLGYPVEEWLEPEFWENHIHSEDRQAAVEFCKASTSRLEAHDFEYRFLCKDGSDVWLRDIVSVAAEDGKPRWLRGVMVDISGYKRMEAHLNEMATTDFLTGIANRRHFVAVLDTEIARLQRFETEATSLLMFDLDHFKQVNDYYGHAVGDRILQHCVSVLRRDLRVIDTIGRLGGEEFGIILPGADLSAARIFAERIRNAVASGPCVCGVCGDRSIGITLSVGVAALDPHADTADAVLARADQALYRAKASGRNRVEVFYAARDPGASIACCAGESS